MKNRLFSGMLAVGLAFTMMVAMLPSVTVQAATTQVKATVAASDTSIMEDGETTITVGLTGTPYEGKMEPNDVILVIDRSSSMSTSEMAEMRTDAKNFVNKLDLTVHRVGVVAYDDSIDTFDLSTDATAVNAFIDTITPSGSTAIGDAVTAACNLLASKRDDAYGSIVLMTDGVSNTGSNPLTAATSAKGKGYFFYTVSLAKSTSADEGLKKMATSENDHYSVFETSGLSQAYNSIVKKIGYCNAKDVVITQTIGDDFELVSGSTADNIPQPTISGNTLTWNMNQLGQGNSKLTYTIRPKDGIAAGTYTHGSGSITYTDYNGDTQTINLAGQSIKVSMYGPEITSVSPASAKSGSDTLITVSGSHFESGATVKMGSVTISGCSISSDTIIFTLPSSLNTGSATIKVTNPDGQSDSYSFKVLSTPEITKVDPASGKENTKTKITIYGTGFVGNYQSIKVYIGGEEAKVSSTATGKIVCKTPKLAAGTYDVKVVNSDSSDAVLTDGYTYGSTSPNPAPNPATDMKLSPTSSTAGSKQKVTITGSGFVGKYNTLKVKVGTTDAKVSSVSTTKIECKFPALSAGTYDVTVTYSNGTSYVLKDAYTYTSAKPTPTPTITKLDKTTGTANSKATVNITGTNFSGTYQTVKVYFGTEEASVSSVSTTKIQCKTPKLAVGTYDVKVVCTNGAVVKTGAYTVNGVTPPSGPTITGLSVTTGTADSKVSNVVISGSGFVGNYSTIKVTVGGVSAKVKSTSTSSVTCQFPALSAGTYDIVITNSTGGSTTLSNAFTYQ